jgi:hypothetical protein
MFTFKFSFTLDFGFTFRNLLNRFTRLFKRKPKQVEPAPTPKRVPYFETKGDLFAYLIKKEDYVWLRYQNEKGEVSEKIATRNMDLVPAEYHPNGNGKVQNQYSTDVRYFDFMSMGWRTAKLLRVLDCKALSQSEALEMFADIY